MKESRQKVQPRRLHAAQSPDDILTPIQCKGIALFCNFCAGYWSLDAFFYVADFI
jgi:hypothetical protein